MKKIFLIATILFFQNYLLIAQSGHSKDCGMITFERVLNFNSNPQSSSFSLFFNPNFSVFYENRKEPQEDAILKPSSDDEFDLSFDVKFNGSKYIVLTNIETDSIQSQVSLFCNGKQQTYIVEEKINTINWKIENEFKTVNDLKVQKAIGEFRGRKYIAWFSNEIPVKYGPWKLNGLPGLILNVADDKNEVMFYVKTIKIPLESESTAKNDFQFNCDIEKISLAEYVKLKEQQVEEVMKLFNSKLPRRAFIDITNSRSNDIEIEYE